MFAIIYKQIFANRIVKCLPSLLLRTYLLSDKEQLEVGCFLMEVQWGHYSHSYKISSDVKALWRKVKLFFNNDSLLLVNFNHIHPLWRKPLHQTFKENSARILEFKCTISCYPPLFHDKGFRPSPAGKTQSGGLFLIVFNSE